MVNLIPLIIVGSTLLGCLLIALIYLLTLCISCSSCCRRRSALSIEKDDRTTSYQIGKDAGENLNEEEKQVLKKLTEIQDESSQS